MRPPFESQNRPARGALRGLGFFLVVVGGIFALVGLVDFFSAFGGRGFPTKFWCAFVGLPMIGIGISCLKAGYLGAIGRYVAGETTPVASESVKYIAEELRPTARRYAEDLRAAAAPAQPDAATRLRQLEELHRSGLVSAAEYAAKRAAILKAL